MAFSDITISQFKGLNISDDPETIDDGELQTCLNFDITPERALARRPSITNRSATSLIASQPVFMMGVYGAVLMAYNDQDVWSSADSGATWTKRHDANQASVSRGVVYTDSFYWATATAGVTKYTGTTPTSMASSPSGEEVCLVNDRMFVLNITDQKIYYSEAGIASWNNTTNQISVAGYGGTPVGMVAYRDKILIFKRELCLILFVSGTPTNWVLRKFPYDVGCVSRSAYIVQDDLIYFIGPEGIYRTDLGNLQDISEPIRSVFVDRYSVISPVLSTLKAVDAIGYWNDRIFCLVKVSTTAASAYRLFVFHTLTNAWSEWLPNLHTSPGGYPFLLPWNFMTVYLSGSNASGMYFGSQETANPARVYSVAETSAPTDDPNGTYSCIMKSKKFTMGASNRFKRANEVSMVGTGFNSVTYTKDSVADAPVAITTRRIPGPGFFRGLEVQLSGPNAASGLPKLIDVTYVLDKKSKSGMANV